MTPAPATLETRAQVHCIVAHSTIGARDCIERQGSMRCFCPRAPFAINAMASLVVHGSKLAEALDRCRSVARSVLREPDVANRHLGPARLAYDGRPAAEGLIAGELPAPPELRKHRRVETMPVPTMDEPPRAARDQAEDETDSSVGAGTEPGRDEEAGAPAEPPREAAKAVPIGPPTPPAAPATQEKTMRPSKLNTMTQEDIEALIAKHSGSITNAAKEIGVSRSGLADRYTGKAKAPTVVAEAQKGKMPKSAPTPKSAPASKSAAVQTSGQPIAPPAAADTDPVVQLLRTKLADAERQAAKYRAALTALEAA